MIIGEELASVGLIKAKVVFFLLIASLINLVEMAGSVVYGLDWATNTTLWASVLLLLVDVVVQEFNDEVDVRQNHPPAAVAFATKLVEGFRS